MGDGSGILLIEDEDYARRRGARIYAELVGYASTADAYHITAPAPGGAGLARAIARALDKSGIAPESVGYINAHGTSTEENDRNETAAIKTVFGIHAYTLAVSSTKSMIGHTLGAAGGIEAGVSVLSLYHSILTPTINLTHPDPECDLDYIPQRHASRKWTWPSPIPWASADIMLSWCSGDIVKRGGERRHTERQPLVGRVKALAEALEGSDIYEIELSESGTKITIRRRHEPEPCQYQQPSREWTTRRTLALARSRDPREPAGLVNGQPNAPEPGVAIIAPLTGVYYSAPSPSSAPFVEIGGTVQAGQVVCIIEAMKVFNELKSEVSGTVSAILPKNGQLVQKNDALIRVKLSRPKAVSSVGERTAEERELTTTRTEGTGSNWFTRRTYFCSPGRVAIAWTVVLLAMCFLPCWWDAQPCTPPVIPFRCFDIGNMDQAVWNTLHGHLFRFTNRGADWEGPPTRLGIHVEPILLLVALFYLIHSGPETLLILQTMALALGAIPLFLLGRRLIPELPLAAAALSSPIWSRPRCLVWRSGTSMPSRWQPHCSSGNLGTRWPPVSHLCCRRLPGRHDQRGCGARPYSARPVHRVLAQPATFWRRRSAPSTIWVLLCFLVILPHFSGGASGGNNYWYRYAWAGTSPGDAIQESRNPSLATHYFLLNSPPRLGYIAMFCELAAGLAFLHQASGSVQSQNWPSISTVPTPSSTAASSSTMRC